MSEQRKVKAPLLPREVFLARLGLSASLGFLMIVFSLSIGMTGYHYFENMSWIDAFANAAMILSGMGPLTPLQTNSGKTIRGILCVVQRIGLHRYYSPRFCPRGTPFPPQISHGDRFG
jgi:hypothetical protein